MTKRNLLTAQEIDQIARRVVEVQLEELDWSHARPFRPWMKQFLRDLERSNASQAIELCPYTRDTVYKHRRACPAFRRQWEGIAEAKRERRAADRGRLKKPTGRRRRSSSTR